MIYEVARIEIDPDASADFEAAVSQALPLFRSAPGCLSCRLNRSLDHPGHYALIVGWESVEAHTVGFRSSPSFQKWRELAGPFFQRPPDVDHIEDILGF
jgi:quinol monooxygenase YgiN